MIMYGLQFVKMILINLYFLSIPGPDATFEEIKSYCAEKGFNPDRIRYTQYYAGFFGSSFLCLPKCQDGIRRKPYTCDLSATGYFKEGKSILEPCYGEEDCPYK